MSGLGTIGYRQHSRIRMLLKVALSLGLFLAGLETTAQNLIDYSKPASHFPYFVGPYVAHEVPPPSLREYSTG